MFFSGTEELVGKLNEEKSAWALQRELERISKRTDFKIRDVVWQGAWRYDAVIPFEVTIRAILLDQTFGWPNHSERTEFSLLEVSKSYNKDKYPTLTPFFRRRSYAFSDGWSGHEF